QPAINLQQALGPRKVAFIDGTGLGGMAIAGPTGNDVTAPAQCAIHPGAAATGVCRKNQFPIQQILNRGIVNNTAWTLDSGVTIKNIIGLRTDSQYLDSAVLVQPVSNNGASGAIGNQGIQSNIQNQLSEELQFSGKSFDNRLDWIAGYFWFRER